MDRGSHIYTYRARNAENSQMFIMINS